jgi:mRNA interferase MazF
MNPAAPIAHPPPAPRRGEVWLVRFDPVALVQGREQAGTRPALIFSIDGFNASNAGLVTVLPITSTNLPLPSRVRVQPPEGGLQQVSYVMGEQTRTISKLRLLRALGMVRAQTMTLVEDVVRTLLGL